MGILKFNMNFLSILINEELVFSLILGLLLLDIGLIFMLGKFVSIKKQRGVK